MIDTASLVSDCIDYTAALTRRFRSRLTGSRQCAECAAVLHERMQSFCDGARIQRFTLHPGSFYSYTKIIPPFYALGLFMLFFPGPWMIVPALGILAGTAMMACIFGFYLHVFDRFFPSKTGLNVIGTIEPSNEPRQQIILSGHHDSAPVTRLMGPKLLPYLAITITVPYLYFIFEAGLLLYLSLTASAAAPLWSIIAAASGLPITGLYFMGVDTSRGTPGAGDNMIASAMVVLLGERIARTRRKAPSSLRHTRIIIASFDGEEAGLRGAAAYFGAQADGLRRIPAYHLNIDSIYNLAELQVLESDINGSQKLSREMADDIVRIASGQGIRIRPFRMVFGGGGTDAAESARAGIRSTTIIGLPTTVVRRNMVYHTAADTVDHIEPEAVEACLKIIACYIEEKEGAIRRVPAPTAGRP